MDMLEGSGFSQYEISNYARPNRECRHNFAYWLGENYLGLGPSAFSTVGDNRWKNVSDTGKYVTAVNANQELIDFQETLSESVRRSEHVAFSLRTNYGVASELIAKAQAEEFAAIGLLSFKDSRWILTPKGRLLADSIAEAFI